MVVLHRRPLASLVLVTALLSPAAAPAQDATDRLDALTHASIFTPRAVATRDIMKGPDYGPGQVPLPFNARVTCEFDTPGGEKGGNTPKFDCRQLRAVSPTGRARGTARGKDAGAVKVKLSA